MLNLCGAFETLFGLRVDSEAAESWRKDRTFISISDQDPMP